ncbi:hypothetical protein DFH08DRAFT_820843 [Mycena albidolilacea]|uniref:Uncharacterized protein n=1 Tax=Mycena albidolilacea TaxID=1033008 RepID=A0AAD6ZBH4_9AGAR|nr:hypothetical protein DFH08DRAFT_820843 [Mycena albidolilacea]
MFPKASLLQFLAALSIVSTIGVGVGVGASPAAGPIDMSRVARDDGPGALAIFGDIIACTDANLSGDCTTLGVTSGVCTCFTGNLAGLNDQVSSMEFDLGAGATCTLYQDNNCSGGSFFVSNTGIINNFQDIGFNDIMTCFKCFQG